MLLKRGLSVLIILALLMTGSAALAANENSVVLRCWVYYSGVQAQMFDEMVQEFNNTVGSEQNIFVEYSSKSSISDLDTMLRASAEGEPGAEPLPDLFASYSDTAYDMRMLDVVADISPYMTQEELALYIDAYVDEGRMGEGSGFYIFPAAKSTEVLILNQTAWSEFQAAAGADDEKLATWEGVAELAGEYYRWTDSLTPETANDGQAFFGRDSMANYLLIGAMQLGCEIFDVKDHQLDLHFDKDVMRRLWDCYYVPYVSGWYTAEGRFRSDDIKTGKIIALVGSTSGALYFPSEVTRDDGTSQSIECSVYAVPGFKGAEDYAVQQGAGFVVSKSTPEREKAAVTFLKWFTEPERNIKFSMGSGYLPVTKAANQQETVETMMSKLQPKRLVRQIIEVGTDITMNYKLYTNAPFTRGYEARQILERTMQEAAAAGSAKRLELMAGGASYDEAVSQLVTDEAFEQWYELTLNELQQRVADIR